MWRSMRRLAPICLAVGVAAVAPGSRQPGAGRRPPAGDPGPGGGAPAAYQGAHRREVRALLDRAAGWRTSRDPRTDGGVPPPVRIGCLRDAHVAAAVQYAWAAESYYRLRHPAAAGMAAAARAELDRAAGLCAGSRADRGRCETVHIWRCPDAP